MIDKVAALHGNEIDKHIFRADNWDKWVGNYWTSMIDDFVKGISKSEFDIFESKQV